MVLVMAADQDLADMVRMYESQVADLNKEIEQLEREKAQLEWLSVGAYGIEQLKRLTADSLTLSEQEKCNKLQEELEMLKNITGILMSDVIIQKSEDGSLEYLLKGSCYDALFEIKLRETTGGLSPAENCAFHITGVEIDSTEIVNNELQDCLDFCESEATVGLFFSLLVPFARCLDERQKAFSAATQLYPDNVVVPGGKLGSVLKFDPQLPSRTTFNINWSVAAQKVFGVKPILRLDVISQQTANKTLDSAVDMFDKLVESLGPTEAIMTFIKKIVDTENNLSLPQMDDRD